MNAYVVVVDQETTKVRADGFNIDWEGKTITLFRLNEKTRQQELVAWFPRISAVILEECYNRE